MHQKQPPAKVATATAPSLLARRRRLRDSRRDAGNQGERREPAGDRGRDRAWVRYPCQDDDFFSGMNFSATPFMQ